MKNNLVILAALAVPAFAHAVAAAEGLSFTADISQSLVHDLSGENLDGISMARTDLNNDGMDEIVLKKGQCPAAPALCIFRLLALSDGRKVELGEIPARLLLVETSHRQGVRNILAYDSAVNDYDYRLYAWDPEAARYIDEKGKPDTP